jgi:hypothetical protein
MASIQDLREALVVGHYRRYGGFREAVEKVRTYWRIDHPPAKLPPESDDILLPSCLDESGKLSELHAVWANHSLLPPLSGGPRDRPSSYVTWLSDWNTAYSNLKLRWQMDVLWAVRQGDVPEEHLKETSPYVSTPTFLWVSEALLPWYRLGAACVLYDAPEDEDDLRTFAEYGGPLSVTGVLTNGRLREQEINHAAALAVDEMISSKMWELRQELPDDPGRARYEVARRFGGELQAE